MQSDRKTHNRGAKVEEGCGSADTASLSSRAEKIASGTLAIALIALFFCISLLAGVPPVDRDALTHHLAVPKLYLRNGGIYEIPHVPFSYYPMNLDLIYMIPLYFGHDIVPKYIHFSFALLTTGLISSYLYRRLRSLAATMLGGLLFLSLPVIIKLSITVYVDLGLIFFSAAALLQLVRWVETGFRIKHIVLSGVFAGLCMGTKPNGMLSFFLLVSAVPFLYHSGSEAQMPWREGGRRAQARIRMALKTLGLSVAFAAIAFLVYSPWMLRNYGWTGNPVYPMAIKLFEPRSPVGPEIRAAAETPVAVTDKEETHEQRAGYGPFILRKLVYGENLFEILAIPLRVFFQGQDDNPKLFDGRMNLYLLIFPLIALMASRFAKRPTQLKLEIRVLGTFSVLYLLFAFFLADMRIRYIAPIIPPLVILAVIGVMDIIALIEWRGSMRFKRVIHGAAGASLLGLLACNMTYIVGQFEKVDPLSYIQGRISRAQYIQKHRPEYAAISFANENLPQHSRILALFNGNRIYYSDREMVCDNESFRKAVDAAKTSFDLQQDLKRRGISHLLVRLDLFGHWVNTQFKTEQKAVLQNFFNESLTRLYLEDGYALFALT